MNPPPEAERRANHRSVYADTFFVPEAARWDFVRDELHHTVGDGLNKALAELEESNRSLDGVLTHIDFNRRVGQSKISDQKLRDLVQHFSKFRLRNEDFEFPDLLGAAYEYLIRDFAGSAGKKGGEFHTPRAVVRLMVRLARPTEGMRVYDPCSGSGGMLILSQEYLDEHGLNSKNLRLYGKAYGNGVPGVAAFAIHDYNTTTGGLAQMPQQAVWAASRGKALVDSESAPQTNGFFNWMHTTTEAQYLSYLNAQKHASFNATHGTTVVRVIEYTWEDIGGWTGPDPAVISQPQPDPAPPPAPAPVPPVPPQPIPVPAPVPPNPTPAPVPNT